MNIFNDAENEVNKDLKTSSNGCDEVGGIGNNDSDIVAETVDYSKYKFNNWIKNEDNENIIRIDKMGGAIWLIPTGDLSYRFSKDGDITTAPHTKAEFVYSHLLDKKVRLLKGTEKEDPIIFPNELKLIHSNSFNPFILEEFYQDKSLNYQNLFKPNKYMMMKSGNYKEPKTILKLIKHLANNIEYRYVYIVNWLAYFMQRLKKSQVALVLRGDQGSGKGILFNEILKPLFSEEYCIVVNDKSLNTNFLGGIVENKLFFNLDEISYDIAGSKNIKNFLKALVTNDSITAEKKFKNIEKETKIYGQVLITSNEPYVIEVETSDRRYTVFTTGAGLPKSNYLGFKSYKNFSTEIKKELKDFCLFLKSYKVDDKLANTALVTEEKKALINATNDRFTMFVNAIKNKDLPYFEEVENENSYLYNELINDFKKDRIKAKNLIQYFKVVNSDEKIKSKNLMNRLRTIDISLFDIKNKTKSSGDDYYIVKSL